MYSLRAINCVKGLAKATLSSKMSQSLMNPMSRSLMYGSRLNVLKHPSGCQCGSCGTCSSLVLKAKAHTNADKDLSVFLDKEIVLEKNNMKAPKSSVKVPGFTVTEDGCNLTFFQKFEDEEITVRLNVNASVDPEDAQIPMDYNPQSDTAPIGEMKSKPDFSVEIKKRSGRTLVMNCSFYRGPPQDDMDANEDAAMQQQQQPQHQGDAFQIDNFFIMEKGESVGDKDMRENIYVGDGEIIDGEMYDLMMNFLDERGITNEFADRLVDYCTHYEHNQYVNLLSNLKSFLSE